MKKIADENQDTTKSWTQHILDSLVSTGHIEHKRDSKGELVYRRSLDGKRWMPVYVATGKPLHGLN